MNLEVQPRIEPLVQTVINYRRQIQTNSKNECMKIIRRIYYYYY
jgi:hypothetical protein